jgi:hypothetical protein
MLYAKAFVTAVKAWSLPLKWSGVEKVALLWSAQALPGSIRQGWK